MKSGSVERNSPQLPSIVEDFFGEVEELTPDSGMASTGAIARAKEITATLEETRDVIMTDYYENMLLNMNTSKIDRISLNDNIDYILRVKSPMKKICLLLAT